MKTKLVAGCIFLLAGIIINSCEDKQGAVPVNVSVSNCDTVKLTYTSDSNTMEAIINVQCQTNNTQCHSSGSISGYDYSTYYGIYANYQSGLLYASLFGNGSVPAMPKVQQPGWDACVIAKFKAWINQGCPD
jgi:hypothetical protein